MTHGIDDQTWVAYLEGELAPQERDRLEAHLIGCQLCWEFHERMARTTARLREGAAAARLLVPLADDDLHRGLTGTLARLRGDQRPELPGGSGMLRERLGSLERMIAVMCGRQTAERALQTAASRSPARSLEGVTPDNWAPFLSNLTSIAAVMCGATGADLVYETGRLELAETR
jgi:hypothetical protein